MSTPISFGGFNNIDFGAVVSALMTQASIPLTQLQSRQTQLTGQNDHLGTLLSRVGAVRTAAASLGSAAAAASATTVTDATAIAVTGASATPGHYDVVVQELARAQVTVSAGSVADPDTTVVATGGTITVGGVDVTVSGPVTLQALATAINDTAGIPVSATVMQTGANAYRLALTSNATGLTGAFTLTNALTGGAGLAFTDTDTDGITGDSPEDNAVAATDAAVLVNNVAITSATNTLTAAIPGATLTLYKKAPATTIGVDVAADTSALKTKVQAFVSAYNDLVQFAGAQATAAGNGDPSSVGRSPVLRQVRHELRAALTAAYPAGGSLTYLSLVGIEFTKTGTLQLDEAAFDAAVTDAPDDVAALFAGAGGADGVFKVVDDLMKLYTQAGGVLPSTQQFLTDEVAEIDRRIQQMQDRLALQRAALQQQFAAADLAMTQLRSQAASLQGFSTQLTSF